MFWRRQTKMKKLQMLNVTFKWKKIRMHALLLLLLVVVVLLIFTNLRILPPKLVDGLPLESEWLYLISVML